MIPTYNEVRDTEFSHIQNSLSGMHKKPLAFLLRVKDIIPFHLMFVGDAPVIASTQTRGWSVSQILQQKVSGYKISQHLPRAILVFLISVLLPESHHQHR